MQPATSDNRHRKDFKTALCFTRSADNMLNTNAFVQRSELCLSNDNRKVPFKQENESESQSDSANLMRDSVFFLVLRLDLLFVLQVENFRQTLYHEVCPATHLTAALCARLTCLSKTSSIKIKKRVFSVSFRPRTCSPTSSLSRL